MEVADKDDPVHENAEDEQDRENPAECPNTSATSSTDTADSGAEPVRERPSRRSSTTTTSNPKIIMRIVNGVLADSSSTRKSFSEEGSSSEERKSLRKRKHETETDDYESPRVMPRRSTTAKSTDEGESQGDTDTSHADEGRKPRRMSKTTKRSSSNDVDRHADYCWKCQNPSGTLHCDTCPRIFHLKCVSIETEINTDRWMCPECSSTLHADSTFNRPEALKSITLADLCNLLLHTLERMKNVQDSDAFTKPVDPKEEPLYLKYITNPMDLSKLEDNIRKRMYGSTQAFRADAKWIQHNSIVFNSHQSPLTRIAKNILKVCIEETEEIDNCPECYRNAHTIDDWFINPCKKPHLLIWARLKGFPFWPAKVMTTKHQTQVDARFFGAHDKAWVDVKNCYLISRERPQPVARKASADLNAAWEELTEHIDKLKAAFGVFTFAEKETPLIIENMDKHLEEMLPCLKPRPDRLAIANAPFIPDSQKKRLGLRKRSSKRRSDDGRNSLNTTAEIEVERKPPEKPPSPPPEETPESPQAPPAVDVPETNTIPENEAEKLIENTVETVESNEVVENSPEKQSSDTDSVIVSNESEKSTSSSEKTTESPSSSSQVTTDMPSSSPESISAPSKEKECSSSAVIVPDVPIKIEPGLQMDVEECPRAKVGVQPPMGQSEQVSSSDQSSPMVTITNIDAVVPPKRFKTDATVKASLSSPGKQNSRNLRLTNEVSLSVVSGGQAQDADTTTKPFPDRRPFNKARKSIPRKIEKSSTSGGGGGANLNNSVTISTSTAIVAPMTKCTPPAQGLNVISINTQNSDAQKSLLKSLRLEEVKKDVPKDPPPPAKVIVKQDGKAVPKGVVVPGHGQILFSQGGQLFAAPANTGMGQINLVQLSNLSSGINTNFVNLTSETLGLPGFSPVYSASPSLPPLTTFTPSTGPPLLVPSSDAGGSTGAPSRRLEPALIKPTINGGTTHSDASKTSVGDVVRDYVQQCTDNVISYLSTKGPPQASLEAQVYLLEKKCEKLEQTHREYVANHEQTIAKLRSNLGHVHKREVAELKSQLAELKGQMDRVVVETKKKQWCAQCGKEALFYCCWNTSYCDYPCQQQHWLSHMNSCGQVKNEVHPPAAQAGQNRRLQIGNNLPRISQQVQQFPRSAIQVSPFASLAVSYPGAKKK